MNAVSGAVTLVHSPRAGRRLAELAAMQRLDRGSAAVVAISADAAEAAGDGWKSVDHSDQPTDDALLALAERLCDNGRE